MLKNSWQKKKKKKFFCLKSWKSTDTVFCLQTYRTWRQTFLQSRVRAPQRDWSRFYPRAPPHCFLLRNRKKNKNKERKTKCSSSLRWRSNSDSPPSNAFCWVFIPKSILRQICQVCCVSPAVGLCPFSPFLSPCDVLLLLWGLGGASVDAGNGSRCRYTVWIRLLQVLKLILSPG